MRYLKWNAIATVSLFVLGLLCLILGERFRWPGLTSVGNWGTSFAFFSCVGFLCVLGKKPEVQQNRKTGTQTEDKTMETKIGNIYSYGGAIAAGTYGPIQQNVRVDSITVQQWIYRFIDDVVEPESSLNATRKNEVRAELNTVADQAVRPPERRDASKIASALERIPQLLSVAKSAMDAWRSLEPLIRAHFQ